MGLLLMFIMSVIFSVIFPSTDVGSDVYLAHQTVNFIGDNYLLQGCLNCFHKDEKDIIEKKENGCTTCFTFLQLDEYSTDEEEYLFSYGTEFCEKQIIHKVLDIEFNSKYCNETFQERKYTDSEGGQKIKIEVESKECDSEHHCCIERVQDLKYSEFDEEIEWQHCIRNNHGCEMCLGIGQLQYDSCYYLQDIPAPKFEKSIPIHKQPFPWDVKNTECNPREKTTFYRINNLTIQQGEVLSINYEQGRCSKDDECCVKFGYAEKNDEPLITHQCYSDICQLTLNWASDMLDRKIDINHWKTVDIYNQGINYGGRLCSSLQTYGWSALFPVLVHSLFGLLLCYHDIIRGKASYFEVPFAVFSFYPQWKVIKLWGKYAIGKINEEQLIEEKGYIEGSVSSIEPFVESCFQVYIW